AFVGVGRLPYHLAPILPPLGLIALAPLAWVLRDAPSLLAACADARKVVCVVAFGGLCVPLFSQSLTHASRAWSTKPAWHALQRSDPAPYEQQGARIRELTSRDDEIYVWGWSPGTYRYAYRAAPSRFATLEKGGNLGSRVDFITIEAEAAIRANPPRIIVVAKESYESTGIGTAEFDSWFKEYYAYDQTIVGMAIFLPKR
ncbi:MAG: hypothetical protein AB7N71_12015, partial [Phycisphaerae bacterium]